MCEHKMQKVSERLNKQWLLIFIIIIDQKGKVAIVGVGGVKLEVSIALVLISTTNLMYHLVLPTSCGYYSLHVLNPNPSGRACCSVEPQILLWRHWMSSRASSHIEKMCSYSNACYLFFLRKGSLAYQASTVGRRGLREHRIVRKSCKLSIYMIFF